MFNSYVKLPEGSPTKKKEKLDISIQTDTVSVCMSVSQSVCMYPCMGVYIYILYILLVDLLVDIYIYTVNIDTNQDIYYIMGF